MSCFSRAVSPQPASTTTSDTAAKNKMIRRRIRAATIELDPAMPQPPHPLARHVLRAPAFVRKAAATQTKDPVEQWMLRQSAETRQSYVKEVLDKGGDDRLAEIWMLRQPTAVRESYISEVLEPALPPKLKSRT
jgi:hypothetical protein